jgi:hypothetical protein
MAQGDGFINEDMWLRAFNGPGWIEAGYGVGIPGAVCLTYFWGENDENSGIFVSHPIKCVPARDVNSYATIAIFNNGPDRATSDSFTIFVQNLDTNFSATTNNSMWSSGQTQSGLVNIGQELYGSNGALAGPVTFVRNLWMNGGGSWNYQTSDTDTQVGSPPYGGWFETPSVSYNNLGPTGGIFETECCTGWEVRPWPFPIIGAEQHLTAHQELQPLGIAAIPVTNAGKIPAFSESELLRFIRSHPIPRVNLIQPNPQVTRLDCNLNAKSAAVMFRGKETGLPGDAQICYVELKGKFAVSRPPTKGAELIFSVAFEVFDARNGNLLLSGALNRPPATGD